MDEEIDDIYVDIRVRFKRVTEEYNNPSNDTFESWELLIPVSIERKESYNTNETDMRDTLETIWESHDGTKFINGLAAAIHGEETTF